MLVKSKLLARLSLTRMCRGILHLLLLLLLVTDLCWENVDWIYLVDVNITRSETSSISSLVPLISMCWLVHHYIDWRRILLLISSYRSLLCCRLGLEHFRPSLRLLLSTKSLWWSHIFSPYRTHWGFGWAELDQLWVSNNSPSAHLILLVVSAARKFGCVQRSCIRFRLKILGLYNLFPSCCPRPHRCYRYDLLRPRIVCHQLMHVLLPITRRQCVLLTWAAPSTWGIICSSMILVVLSCCCLSELENCRIYLISDN